VIFDLDDTLYPEIEFVKSGFRAVAHYLSLRYCLDADALFTKMLGLLRREGRGKIFDILLQELGMRGEEMVRLLVFLYRSHSPTIQLYPDAHPTLSLLRERDLRLGIITDGLASVQRKKVQALNLVEMFDLVIYTDEVGRAYWKPSPVPYQVALNLLAIEPQEAVYIGNDLAKDFLGANKLGVCTVQIERSMQKSCVQTHSTDLSMPKAIVNSLDVVFPFIKEMCDE
jgi:putative hydrolase of the HAD superfamily